jgi:hypothetical protein
MPLEILANVFAEQGAMRTISAHLRNYNEMNGEHDKITMRDARSSPQYEQ